MEYSSFYGGRRGASFIIAKSFRLISEDDISQYEDYITEEIEDTIKYPNGRADWILQNVMSVAFRQGNLYKTVNYDEYVIIDTFNKNDINNGKIYRRGYNYANDPNELGGAEYIGQIVGPAGLGPHLEFGTMDEVEETYEEAAASDQLSYRTDTGTYSVDNNSIIPGKDGNTYNDEIEWMYVSIRDAKSLETTTYIGFKIPYHVIEFEAETIDEDYETDEEHLAQTGVERLDDGSHPFYEKWKIKIPKGVKGDTLQNFRLYTPEEDEEMDDINNITHELEAGKTVLVYDYVHYDNVRDGEVTTLYLGEYDVIDDITLANDGTITVSYKGNKVDTVFDRAIKYITQIELTPQGQLTVTYNNNRTINGQGQTYTTTLTWVTGIAINQNGSVTTTYNNGDPSTTGRNLQWVSNVRIDNTAGTNNGKIYRQYSNSDSENEIGQIKYINDITLGTDGTITYKYNTNETAKTDSNKVRWITGSTYNATAGTLTFSYNYGASDVYTYKYIESVDLSDNGVFTVTDNTGTVMLETTLKWVEDIDIFQDHFRILYSDGTTQTLDDILINQIQDVVIPTSGTYKYHLLVLYSAASAQGTITYDNRTGWTDLGVVKDYSGVLVGTNIDASEDPSLATVSGTLAYLDDLYPDGITDGSAEGKIVTVGESTTQKKFYAYDYLNNAWFYLGSLDNSLTFIIGDETVESEALGLPVGSVWFVTSGEDDE